jgi:tryptophanyl-tRNA synthetase
VSNLLTILGATTGEDPVALADRYEQYGPLKSDTADAVCAYLEPIQARFREYAADPAGTAAILAKGARKAEELAAPTLARAREALGLLPRG